MTHDELVAALRDVDGLRDVGSADRPNFQLRGRPFLHFHSGPEGTYADVRLGTPDFRPFPAETSAERQELLGLVLDHVTPEEPDRRQDRRQRRRRA